MAAFVFFVVVGYLAGSVSPGYFFGRIVKRIDIRKCGSGSTGATNVHRNVGPVYGVITAILDAAKSGILYLAAVMIGRLDPNLALVPGLAAVAGHVWPFYLNFKGGRGAASLFGLLFAAFYFTQSVYFLIFFVATVVYSIILARRDQRAQGVRPEAQEATWRKALKLAALLLPLSYIVAPRALMLGIMGTLLAVSLALDALRLFSRKANDTYLKAAGFAKQKEERRLSGYSFFLLGAFSVTLLFPMPIAVSSLVFFILGDTLAPLGREFIPVKLFRGRTVGGFGIIFGISFSAGIFLRSLAYLPITIPFILFGAAFTAIIDLFSFALEDNFLVPFGTALMLSVISRY